MCIGYLKNYYRHGKIMVKRDEKQGDELMAIATYNKQHNEYIEGIRQYIKSLESMDPTSAKREARNSLYESGVITKKGGLKKQIVRK